MTQSTGKPTRDKALVGAAGEHYVAFRLSAEGYAVGLTARGTTALDLLVANPRTGSSITIQTKTATNAWVASRKWGNYWKWRIGSKRLSPSGSFFYVLLNLRDDPSGAPAALIVPSTQLGPLLETFGTGRPDVWCTIYEKDKAQYLERWDLITAVLG